MRFFDHFGVGIKWKAKNLPYHQFCTFPEYPFDKVGSNPLQMVLKRLLYSLKLLKT